MKWNEDDEEEGIIPVTRVIGDFVKLEKTRAESSDVNAKPHYSFEKAVDELQQALMEARNEAQQKAFEQKKSRVDEDLLSEFNAPGSIEELSKAMMKQFSRAVLSRSSRSEPEILIVEDQLFFNKLLQSILKGKYSIRSATKAFRALEIYLTSAPDIVLVDIMLPDVDGHALCSMIMRLDPDAFIVMVTGQGDWEHVKHAASNGAKDFITKPYSARKITEIVEKFKVMHKKCA
jgi:two-component system, chemotaxis family, chemotaxis protein CheY